MSNFSRSDLFVINDTCSGKDTCAVCQKLGFTIKHRLPESSIHEFISGVNSSPAKSVVIPSPSLEHPNIWSHLKLINKPKKLLAPIEHYLTNPQLIKKKFSGRDIGIIFDNYLELDHSTLPVDSKLFFLIDPQNFELFEKFKNFYSNSFEVSFFCHSNNLFAEDQIRPDELLDGRYAKFCNRNALLYGVPFDYDIVDIRNKEHSNWCFTKNECFRRQIDDSEIKISIVIPFCNRSSFMKLVLSQIFAGTLDKRFYELILIDDGSATDEHRSLCDYLQKLPPHNIQLHYISRREGITERYISNRAGPARNLGANLSGGDILLFLDSDILLPRTYLENLLELHRTNDVILPIRQYLTCEATNQFPFDLEKVTELMLMATPWDAYKDVLYSSTSWMTISSPWLYLMTYCLSVSRTRFFETGGFRTNYISYGFEDIDFGSRLLRIPLINYLNIKTEVFHLNHFNNKNEYTLEPDLRYYQLAFSAASFISQTLPFNSPGLPRLARFRSEAQKQMFQENRGQYL